MKLVNDVENSRVVCTYNDGTIEQTIFLKYIITPENRIRFEATREWSDDIIDLVNSGEMI